MEGADAGRRDGGRVCGAIEEGIGARVGKGGRGEEGAKIVDVEGGVEGWGREGHWG